jgi:hypothetical protein
MRRALLILPLLLMGADKCKPTPTPTPVPTPPPDPIHHSELLLRQSGGVLTRGGLPHKFKQCIPCWDPLELDHGGWSGFSPAWVDYSTAQGGCNAFHMRLGPSKTDPADVTWAGTGGLNEGMGPYLNDDPAQGFNQSWWDRALGMVRNAEEHQSNVEVDLIDGWGCKHAVWGDVPHVWSDADVKACGNVLTETHRQHLRKAVETFGCDAGVIWSDGNEVGQTPRGGPFRLPPRPPLRYSASWTLGMVDLIRQYEQELGCGVVHMFGTNSENPEVEGSPKIDYTSAHDHNLVTGPVAGKWRLNNERNPSGSPAVECAAHCTAEKAGQAWAYWRGAQSKADMDATLACMKDCSVPPTSLCPDPKPDPAKLSWNVKPSSAGYYDPTPLMNDCGYCRSIGMGEINGVPRCTCPARNECPDTPGYEGMCESRVACEQVLMQTPRSPAPVWRSDGTVILDTNGWRAKCENCSWLEVCNGPRTNCKRAW